MAKQQIDIVYASENGDVMTVLPTGFGKSLAYELIPYYMGKGFLGELKKNIYQEKVSHIIVDEAHCIETWGESFRTDYRQLDMLRAILPQAKVVALTATATKTTKKHIAKHLRFCANYSLVSASCDRPNLFYSVNSRPSHNSVNKTPEEAYEEVLKPILMELKVKKYPTTATDYVMS
ncbi:ATP-dependent DNA helicase Q1-like [Haliotis cracherodii]|uniref:ATP-dependent DNA helicase Q1-like n=1 Tax=Haliotis cracherodii TaxID=6455 RepID=UPI0039EA8A5C